MSFTYLNLIHLLLHIEEQVGERKKKLFDTLHQVNWFVY